jgi:hypothetical protein
LRSVRGGTQFLLGWPEPSETARRVSGPKTAKEYNSYCCNHTRFLRKKGRWQGQSAFRRALL